jgi:LysM repeat protein
LCGEIAVLSRTFLSLTALALVAGVVAVACGGGSDSGDRPNSRKIPTATAYAVLPEPTILSGGVPVTSGGGGDTYVVKAGDSLASIAAELGVSMEELISLNDLEDPSRLEVDQVLKIPPRGGTSATPGPGTSSTPQATPGESAAGTEEYEVQSGDNASDIAARFGITLDELAEANDMTVDELRTLYVGQILTIPQFPGRTIEPTSIPEPEVTEEPIEVPTEEPTEAPPEETPIPEELTPTPFEDIGGAVETATPEGGG